LPIAGLAPNTLDVQLFGAAIGRRSSPGIIAAHDGGTIHLDGIDDLSLEVQPKLLRFLESRELLPVGGEGARRVDVLVIATTSQSLPMLVEARRFRRDLLERFSGLCVELPPLRERVEDVFAVISALTHGSASAVGFEIEALERLLLHDFPGNVRELARILETLRAGDCGDRIGAGAVENLLGAIPRRRRISPSLEELREALLASGNDLAVAAGRLGLSRGRFRSLLFSGAS
jgi:DNA-binding NtrC family response regulator